MKKIVKLRGWRTRDYATLLVTLSIYVIAVPFRFILSIVHSLFVILGIGTKLREWNRWANLIGRRPVFDCVVSTTDGLFKLRRSIDHLGTAWTMFDELSVSQMFQPKDGEIVLDVGANIGLYTIRASRLVGNQGKVIAIEAEPANFDALLFNLKLNQANNVIPLNLAAWNRETMLELHLFDCVQSHSLVSVPEETNLKSIKVKAR
ncbi:FkbM family methyltransferase, partial [Chloroflexota bacterium]